jgi:hypothetical protein
MADISYTRAFAHTDWIDGESIVQAGTENGLNTRFHGCEGEFDKISTVFAHVNTAIKNLQQLTFLSSQPTITVAANSSSPEFDVEIYDRTPLPPNVDKAYFCVIFPVTGINVFHTFLYHQIPGNKIRVTVSFYNPTGAQVGFGYRILALATQTS